MVKLAELCGYSIDLRCQLLDKGVQNTDAGGDYEKNEDEGDFSFAYTNPDGSSISTNDIFQNSQIRPVFLIFQSGSPVRRCRRRRFFQSQRGCRFIFLSAAAIEEALL
ncbi:hypothetical protein CerSpe_288360 [Prunus speciosa]